MKQVFSEPNKDVDDSVLEWASRLESCVGRTQIHYLFLHGVVHTCTQETGTAEQLQLSNNHNLSLLYEEVQMVEKENIGVMDPYFACMVFLLCSA